MAAFAYLYNYSLTVTREDKTCLKKRDRSNLYIDVCISNLYLTIHTQLFCALWQNRSCNNIPTFCLCIYILQCAHNLFVSVFCGHADYRLVAGCTCPNLLHHMCICVQFVTL